MFACWQTYSSPCTTRVQGWYYTNFQTKIKRKISHRGHRDTKRFLATEDTEKLATKRHKKHRFVHHTVILSKREESPKHLNILKQKSTKKMTKKAPFWVILFPIEIRTLSRITPLKCAGFGAVMLRRKS